MNKKELVNTLREYPFIERRLSTLYERWNELVALKYGGGQPQAGVKAGVGNPTAAIVERGQRYDHELETLRKHLEVEVSKKEDIEALLDYVSDTFARQAVSLRFMYQQTWAEVAETIRYSERQCQRLADKGLAEICAKKR